MKVGRLKERNCTLLISISRYTYFASNTFRKKRDIIWLFLIYIGKIVYVLDITLLCVTKQCSFLYYKNYKNKSEKYARDIWYAAALIILNFISTVRGMDFLFFSFSLLFPPLSFSFFLFLLRVARFGRVKWKSFYQYAYCRMSGEEKKAFVPINVHRLYS